MKKLLLFIPSFTIFTATPSLASADVSGLVPCKDSAVFKRRLDGSVKKLSSRLANYEEGTPAYLALEAQIEKTKVRFDKYGKQGLLCGADGLPHLIQMEDQVTRVNLFYLELCSYISLAGLVGQDVVIYNIRKKQISQTKMKSLSMFQ